MLRESRLLAPSGLRCEFHAASKKYALLSIISSSLGATRTIIYFCKALSALTQLRPTSNVVDGWINGIMRSKAAAATRSSSDGARSEYCGLRGWGLWKGQSLEVVYGLIRWLTIRFRHSFCSKREDSTHCETYSCHNRILIITPT